MFNQESEGILTIFKEESRVRFIKILRVVLILAIFVAVDILLYRHFFQIHSYNGFVNGSLVKVYPPEKGYMAMNDWIEGATIQLGSIIGDIYSQDPNESKSLNNRSVPLKAPGNGVIYALHSHSGEQVNPDRAALDILDCNRTWVDTFVNEQDVAKIDTTKPVEIRLLGNEELPPMSGKIRFVRYGAEQTMNDNVRNLAEWQEVQDKNTELVMKLRPYKTESIKLALVRIDLNGALPTNQHNFCYVGSKVEAVFRRK